MSKLAAFKLKRPGRRSLMSENVCPIHVYVHNNCHDFIGESLFLAGNFNNWSSKHLEIGQIPHLGESCMYLLDLNNNSPAELELKVSRGDWETLSCASNGRLQAAHRTNVLHNRDIHITIEAWRDQFPKSTASQQVHVLDSHFFFPQLNVYRKVWIYLPAQYVSSSTSYPVLYMHDGQHLFDESTSLGRSGPVEWMVDETIDEAPIPSIVVAIDHAESYDRRQEEYLVHATQENPSPKGWAYLEDIIHTLKPYVDKHYRTLADPLHTAIIGSSMGGLMSLYAGFKYPHVFGNIVAFSPSIWMDEKNLYTYSKTAIDQKMTGFTNQMLYMYTGDQERRLGLMNEQSHMQHDLERYHHWLLQNYPGQLIMDIGIGAKHGAIYWQQAFRQFYAYWQTKIQSLKLN